MEQYKLEKSYESILKTVLKEKAGDIINKIKSEDSIINFFEKLKENPQDFEKLINKEHIEKIIEILKTQKKKNSELKKEVNLTTTKPNGITLIKEILSKIEGIEIKYIAAGRYSLKKEE